MKKIIALILAAMMLVMSFASCNTDYDDDEAIEEKEKDRDEKDTEADDTEADDTEADDTEADDTEADDTEADDTEVVEADSTDDVSIRGEINGNVYHNDYTGLTFTKPGSWEYGDDEQIASILNLGIEQLNADEAMKTLAQSGTLYDMMVYDPATGSNVIAIYEDLNVTNLGMKITAERYCENVMKMLPDTTGLPYELVSQETVTLCGEEYVRMVLSVEANGVELTQAYYARSFDHLMYSFVLTLMGDITVNDVEAMFD